MKENTLLEQARRALRIEAESIMDLISRIDESFIRAVEMLYECKGRVVVTGIGKSGIIGRKLVATFASTGTPALFMHPAEGVHGDLGMIVAQDVIIAISYSGETEEVNKLLPSIKGTGAKLIALTGNPNSTLARNSDIVLNVKVRQEACPLGLVPTASTTATLAFGDALAIALLKKRGFKKEDFALLHPAGTLGRRLLLRVEDVMHKGTEIPLVETTTKMKDVLFEISSKRLGVTGVIDKEGKLVGVITDGDLRRLIERTQNIWDMLAGEVMTRNPKVIEGNQLAAYAVQKMEKFAITSLFIVDGSGVPYGVVHLHDLLKASVV
jgi:arabinose-5-phosphate isomerase